MIGEQSIRSRGRCHPHASIDTGRLEIQSGRGTRILEGMSADTEPGIMDRLKGKAKWFGTMVGKRFVRVEEQEKSL